MMLPPPFGNVIPEPIWNRDIIEVKLSILQLFLGAACADNSECTGADQVCDVGNTDQCTCGPGFIDDNGSCVAGILYTETRYFIQSKLTLTPLRLFLRCFQGDHVRSVKISEYYL